jgi:hypothetical protein
MMKTLRGHISCLPVYSGFGFNGCVECPPIAAMAARKVSFKRDDLLSGLVITTLNNCLSLRIVAVASVSRSKIS